MPDKYHLHHQLLKLGFSHRNTVLMIYAMDILFAAAAIFYVLKDSAIGKYIFILIFLLIAWIVLRTSIISEKKLLKKQTKK